MTLVANFAMGTAGVVDTGGKFATCVNDTCRCQRHLWQIIMGTIADWSHLKVNLKEKIYLLLTLLLKGVQTK
jgi:hypothetical protein